MLGTRFLGRLVINRTSSSIGLVTPSRFGQIAGLKLRVRARIGVGHRQRWTSTTSEAHFSASKSDMTTWKNSRLDPSLISALCAAEHRQPTTIQQITVPHLLQGSHCVICAQSGTGKTLSYLLPIFHCLKAEECRLKRAHHLPNRPRAIVVVPNRELAVQVESEAKKLSHYCKLRAMCVVGGLSLGKQRRVLSDPDRPIDIVISTPGRLQQLIASRDVFLSQMSYLVFDEIDMLYEEGFDKDVDNLVTIAKKLRQDRTRNVTCVIVSATYTQKVLKWFASNFPNAKQLIAPRTHTVVRNMEFEFIDVGKHLGMDKLDELLRIMKAKKLGSDTALEREKNKTQQSIIFTNTVKACRAVAHALQEEGFAVCNLHGGVPPKLRAGMYEKFKKEQVDIMVATDVAARGLDTLKVNHVILFDFARTGREFLHRVGRTARARRHGRVTCLIGSHEKYFAHQMRQALRTGSALDDLDRYRISRRWNAIAVASSKRRLPTTEAQNESVAESFARTKVHGKRLSMHKAKILTQSAQRMTKLSSKALPGSKTGAKLLRDLEDTKSKRSLTHKERRTMARLRAKVATQLQ